MFFKKPIKLTIKTIKDKDSEILIYKGDSLALFNKGDNKNPPIFVNMVGKRELIICINPFKFHNWDKKRKDLKVE